MRIANFKTEKNLNTTEVSSIVDSYKMWFRIPSEYSFSDMADPFLAVALLPAMSQGEDIEIDPAMKVSTQLLKNTNKIQQIFHSWNPALKIIHVSANEGSSKPVNEGVFTFFSGGVDSTYTFLKNMNRITHIVNIHGFDFLYLDKNEGSTFSIDDIKDLSQFARRIIFPQKATGEQLKNALPHTTRDILKTYIISNSPPAPVESELLMSLNDVVNSGAFTKNQLTDSFPRELIGKYNRIYDETLERNSLFAQIFKKKFITIETNHYAFGYRYNLSRNLTQGSCLGAIALLLGFPQVYIPAAYSYGQLFPLGSHPLTDPLWSNESVTIDHDGCEANRTGKLKLIAKNNAALENLRVCFDDSNHNCGKCPKCIRTMIPLKLLGASLDAFPPFPSLESIRKAKISGEIEEAFLEENIALSMESTDHEMRQALLDCRNRIERSKFIKDIILGIDKLFLKSRIKSFHATRQKPYLNRIDTTPRN